MRSTTTCELVELKIIRETEKAIRVRQERKNREPVEDWLPLSQVSYIRRQVGYATLTIPEWLADEKGFYYN